MIKFFRKIRYNLIEQNKTGKYFKYAIGEIILVVIGILIALSINNWNEEKKTQQRIVSFLIEIQNNLDNDILKANSIIDNYIIKDSLLRNIRQNKVLYKDFTQDQDYIHFTYEYENFVGQTKGFDGLVKNIDNIPKKYSNIMKALNEIFITNKALLDNYSKRFESIVNANLDDLKTKDWVLNYWDWQTNKVMIDYFQSERYKIEAIHYHEAYEKMIEEVIKFKIDAIIIYNKIEKVTDGKKEIPDHISYSINNPEVLNLFSGTYQEYNFETKVLKTLKDQEMAFSVEDNQLIWNYSYKDKYKDEKWDIPIFWHKDFTFIYYGSAGIWKFETAEGEDVFLIVDGTGKRNKYRKTTKD